MININIQTNTQYFSQGTKNRYRVNQAAKSIDNARKTTITDKKRTIDGGGEEKDNKKHV